jgi:foldase protein PrsA
MSIAAPAAVLLASLGLAACGGGVPSNAVVKVAETPVSKEAFNHWMRVASASQAQTTGFASTLPVPPHYTACIALLKKEATKATTPPSNAGLKKECEMQYKTFKTEVMSFLISTEWVIQEAKRLGVHVTDQEVMKELEKLRKREFPKEELFKKFLSTSGETISDLLLRVKVDMLGSRIEKKVGKGAKISESDVRKYYEMHQSTYGKPEAKDLLVVLTKTEAEANKAKQEIESGKSFASVAKARSIEPTSKNNGGQINGVARGQEEKSLETAIFSAKENVLSGPVKTPFGSYIFEVKKTIPAVTEPFSKVQKEIKQSLAAHRQQTRMSAFLKAFQKRWREQTDCPPGYVVEDCKQYQKPKTTATPTGPTGVK